jgi:predicted DNA-binding transcriptional regulator AlpA
MTALLETAPGQVISDRALFFEEMQPITKLGRTATWQAIKDRGFPRPLRVHKNRNAWMLSEVLAWMRKQPRAGEVEGAPEKAAQRMREARQAKRRQVVAADGTSPETPAEMAGPVGSRRAAYTSTNTRRAD